MAVAGEVAINLTARVEALEKNLKRGARAFKDFGKESEGTIKGIKQRFGEESTLGNIGKMIKGAGAVAAVGLIAGALRDTTAKAVELKNAFDAGKISAGGVAEELVKSLPIIGSVYQTMANVAELMTGVQAKLAAAREMDSMWEKTTQEYQNAIKATAEYGRATAKYLDDVESRLTRMRKSGLSLQLFDVNQEYRQSVSGIEANKKSALESSDMKALRDRISTMSGKAYDLQAQRARLQADADAGWVRARKALPDMDAQIEPVLRGISRTKKLLASLTKQIEDDAAQQLAGAAKQTVVEKFKAVLFAGIEGIGDLQDKLQAKAQLWNFNKTFLPGLFKNVKAGVDSLLFSDASMAKSSAQDYMERTKVSAEKLKDRLAEATAAYKNLMSTPSTQLLDTLKQMAELLAAGKINAFQYASSLNSIASGGPSTNFGPSQGDPRSFEYPPLAAREFRPETLPGPPGVSNSGHYMMRVVKAAEAILTAAGRSASASERLASQPTPLLLDY